MVPWTFRSPSPVPRTCSSGRRSLAWLNFRSSWSIAIARHGSHLRLGRDSCWSHYLLAPACRLLPLVLTRLFSLRLLTISFDFSATEHTPSAFVQVRNAHVYTTSVTSRFLLLVSSRSTSSSKLSEFQYCKCHLGSAVQRSGSVLVLHSTTVSRLHPDLQLSLAASLSPLCLILRRGLSSIGQRRVSVCANDEQEARKVWPRNLRPSLSIAAGFC